MNNGMFLSLTKSLKSSQKMCCDQVCNHSYLIAFLSFSESLPAVAAVYFGGLSKCVRATKHPSGRPVLISQWFKTMR